MCAQFGIAALSSEKIPISGVCIFIRPEYVSSVEIIFCFSIDSCGVFCLFRIGNQVMDTPSLVAVDRSTMDIIFNDIVIL